jgi:hypothetical protein
MTKDDGRALSEPTAATDRVVDLRPQFCNVPTPAGPARIRRLQPEQLFLFLSDLLPAAAIDAADISIGSWNQHVVVAKLIQRCLVRKESNRLLFHGEEGLRVLCSWSRVVLTQLAREAAKLMEF